MALWRGAGCGRSTRSAAGRALTNDARRRTNGCTKNDAVAGLTPAAASFVVVAGGHQGRPGSPITPGCQQPGPWGLVWQLSATRWLVASWMVTVGRGLVVVAVPLMGCQVVVPVMRYWPVQVVVRVGV